MEIRGRTRAVPSRPIVLAMAALAVLALALTSWYMLSARVQNSGLGVQQGPLTNQLPLDCRNDPYSPRDPSCQPNHDPYSPHDPVN